MTRIRPPIACLPCSAIPIAPDEQGRADHDEYDTHHNRDEQVEPHRVEHRRGVFGLAQIDEFLKDYPSISRSIDAQLRLSPVAQFDLGLELILRGLDTRR